MGKRDIKRQIELWPQAYGGPQWLKGKKSAISLGRYDDVDHCGKLLLEFIEAQPQIRRQIIAASAVLIKVNLTSDELPENGRTTSPFVLGVILDVLFSIGLRPGQLLVADSSVIGVDTTVAAVRSGIMEACTDKGVTFLDLNVGPFVEIQVPNARRISVVSVHQLGIDKDIFKINCAKIKTTYGSPVGLSVKNLKGLIHRDAKLSFHLLGVQDCLVDLRHILTCDLNILEGFPASELGQAKACNILGISDDDILLDGAVSTLIGIPYDNVPHLKQLVEESSERMDFLKALQESQMAKAIHNKFRYAQHGVSDFGQDFGVEMIDGKPCSACLESFYKALVRLDKKDSVSTRSAYVLGQWHVDTRWERYLKVPLVFVGTCSLESVAANGLSSEEYPSSARNRRNMSRRTAIPGCPPTIDSMCSILERIHASDIKHSEHSPERRSRFISDGIKILPLHTTAIKESILEVIRLMPKEEISFTDLPARVAVQCELLTSAICHQMNWDFLRARIKEAAVKDIHHWDFDRIRHTVKKDIEELLSGYTKPERIRSEERARLVRELCHISTDDEQTFYEILERTENRILGPGGLISVLSRSKVFTEDPQAKKAQVLIHSLLREKLWMAIDEENIRPAVDYHVMRLYIRRGNVFPRTKAGEQYLRDNIRRRTPTTSTLRSQVADAIRIVAISAKCSIVDVNSAEWWIGRTVCTRKAPDCNLVKNESSWLRSRFSECPYKGSCLSNGSAGEPFNEPLDTSRYY